MRKWLPLVLVTSCVLSALSCRQATKPTTAGDNAILALALTHKFDDGGHTVVSPETGTGMTGVADPEDLAQLKRYATQKLQLPGVDVGKLIDDFAAKNRKSVRLTLASAPEKGYLIDFNGEYAKYFGKDGGGGWDAWYKDHPKAHGQTTVSLPAWDRASGTVLLYMGTQSHWLAGAGFLIAYKYDGTTLREIKRVMMWIS